MNEEIWVRSLLTSSFSRLPEDAKSSGAACHTWVDKNEEIRHSYQIDDGKCKLAVTPSYDDFTIGTTIVWEAPNNIEVYVDAVSQGFGSGKKTMLPYGTHLLQFIGKHKGESFVVTATKAVNSFKCPDGSMVSWKFLAPAIPNIPSDGISVASCYILPEFKRSNK